MLLLPHLATAETWYVKKSSTKLQAEASARSKEGGNSIFMSTHPSTGERYNRLKKNLEPVPESVPLLRIGKTVLLSTQEAR